MTDSRISGFYRKSVRERIDELAARGLLDGQTAQLLREGASLLTAETADKMVENVIGVFGLPLAVAPNFLVNGKNYIVPMVVEEPSIVAGVSGAARLFRKGGGFRVTASDPVLIGQIHLPGIENADETIREVRIQESRLLRKANELQPNLKVRGGGAKAIEYYKYGSPGGSWTVVLHLLVDTRDAMGANIVNTMCEGIAPLIESITGLPSGLKILSNLADKSLVTASGVLPLDALGSNKETAISIRDAVVGANDFANADPYRAATHNKGIMNGMDAVAIATGNDWRSVEAAAHAFAVRSGKYGSLTNWSVNPNGDLNGQLCLPVKVGIVGGSLRSNPAAVAGLQIANVDSAVELAQLMAAVGLAQNFAALRALVTDGIQKGHMRLHARSVAASATTPPELFDRVVAEMVESGDVKDWKARELIASLGNDQRSAPVPDTGTGGVTGSAAGKVIVLGEHAVVYDKHALALPLPDAIAATVGMCDDGVHLSIPAWSYQRSFTARAPTNDGASAAVSLLLRRLNVPDQGFRINVESRIPAGMGLGSSATLVVAITRALAKLLDLGLDDEAINSIAFECEKLAHGTPSGIDNTLAVYGQPVLYRKGARPSAKVLTLSETPPLVIASSHQRGVTKDQVAGVRRRFEQNEALYGTIFNEIDEMSVAGASALGASDYDLLGSLMNVCHGMLNALQVSTPELESMVDIARRNGAIGAKLTGAGGGGSIVALCPNTIGDVAHALRSAGYQIVRTTASDGARR